MNNIKPRLFLIMVITGVGATYAMPADTDGDGYVDTVDNCIDVSNPDQTDTDGDGHGNICDGDFDNNCATSIFDTFAFKSQFGSPAADPEFDLNSSGGATPVNVFDLFIFKGLFGLAPGPSAAGSLCNPDSDNDGVADTYDLCPGTPPGSTVDADGCIIPPVLISATATASSSGPAGGPNLAVDGNITTRWESAHGIDPSWITLDLGAFYALSKVDIHWEAANAATYQIQGSSDGSSWTTLSSQSGGVFGDRTDNVTVSGTYQYVRMYGQTRTSPYGYSIWEMEVYGLPAIPPADDDGDGVENSLDQCPGTPPGSPVNAVGCIDTDSDGVADTDDLCPGTPPGTTVDTDGCAVAIPVNEVTSINGILAGGSGASQPGFSLYVFDNDLACARHQHL